MRDPNKCAYEYLSTGFKCPSTQFMSLVTFWWLRSWQSKPKLPKNLDTLQSQISIFLIGKCCTKLTIDSVVIWKTKVQWGWLRNLQKWQLESQKCCCKVGHAFEHSAHNWTTSLPSKKCLGDSRVDFISPLSSWQSAVNAQTKSDDWLDQPPIIPTVDEMEFFSVNLIGTTHV